MRKLRLPGLLFLIGLLYCGLPGYGQTDTASINADSIADVAIDSAVTVSDSLSADSDDSLLVPVSDSIRYPGQLRAVPRRLVDSLQRQPAFAYANDPEYWKKEVAAHPGFGNSLMRFLLSKAFRIIFLILLILLLAFGLYRLALENSFTWFNRSRKNTAEPNAQIESENDTDFDAAIQKEAAAGNYKMAVHYLYLKAIRLALEKDLIRIRSSSTNAEIINAFGNPQQANDFRYLATAYEYIFYGDFIPETAQFQAIRQRFNQFYQNILS